VVRETVAASTTRDQTSSRWPGRPPPPLAQLAVAGCGARSVAHDSPGGARPRTSHAAYLVRHGGAELARVQPTTAEIELHTPTRIHSSKQQRDVVMILHVTSVYFNCFKYFRDMLPVFYIDVAKVDREVAHVAMVF
jgi:hypothetical protein